MTPDAFVTKWIQPSADVHQRMAMFTDLKTIVDAYCTLAGRGERADAYTLAADVARPIDEALAAIFESRAVGALKGEP